MRKRFFNGKRIMTLLLALSLVMGETGVVWAAPVAAEEQTETSVSANEVTNDTGKNPESEDVTPETAYDGTVSKVIGLKGKSRFSTKYVNGTETQEQKVTLTWNSLSSVENYLYDNKVVNIGYQVEQNGVSVMDDDDYVSADAQYKFITNNTYWGDTVVTPGQVMNYRVRGLYYTKNEVTTATGAKTTTYNVFAVGEWSDTYSYTCPAMTKVAAPASVTVQYVENEEYYDEDDDDTYTRTGYKVSWPEVSGASAYYLQYIRSTAALTNLTADNWNDAYELEEANPGVSVDCYNGRDVYEPECFISDTSGYYKYIYVRVCIEEIYDYLDGYTYSYNEYSPIAAAAKPTQAATPAAKVANVPQVQNFKAEFIEGGDDYNDYYRLTWTPVDANVVIYAVETAKGFPDWHTYNILRPFNKTEYYDEWDDEYYTERSDMYLNALDSAKVNKVISTTESGMDGECYIYTNLMPKYGVDYSFIAYTYDYELQETAKATPITYDGVSYAYYTDMGPASAVATAKAVLGKPGVSIASAPDSLKLTLTGGGTGYEIYKKTGKKYKKLTVTTDSVYTDVDLKKNSKYNYKVRAYYYNRDSKAKCYSEWVYVTGETSDVANMKLEVTKKSKTSAMLKWTKVKGAVRYEIYRSNADSSDPFVYSKKNSVGSKNASTAYASKYELIKTIKKASTTKYVDKKLTSGDSYYYLVKAYYKNGKSTMYTSAGDWVYLGLETPSPIASFKGTTLKLTWDKDKFASNYEIKYQIEDADGKLVSVPTSADEYTYTSTKKTSYSISNIPVGGYVRVSMRASGSGKYTEWTTKTGYAGLEAVKNIKASNVTVKNTAGADVNTVQITWKAVPGAAYYKVYRSTKQYMYNADTKTYNVPTETTIAKESNDNETNSEVKYKEYENVSNSIVGTSAYDNARLDDGVTYYYYVKAFSRTAVEDNVVESVSSSKPACVTYKAAVNPTVSSKKGKATIKWDKVAGATKYYVYRSTKKGSGYKLVGSTKKPTYTDKKVSKGKTYYYKIEARGTNALKANFSSMSAAKKIKVKK